MQAWRPGSLDEWARAQHGKVCVWLSSMFDPRIQGAKRVQQVRSKCAGVRVANVCLCKCRGTGWGACRIQHCTCRPGVIHKARFDHVLKIGIHVSLCRTHSQSTRQVEYSNTSSNSVYTNRLERYPGRYLMNRLLLVAFGTM